MKEYLIYALGFIAAFLFFFRSFLQWYKSEKESKVESPAIYWQLSLIGSILLLIYGVLRNDFAIVFGQFLVYFIYIRNLQLQFVWQKMKISSRFFIIAMPIACFVWISTSKSYNLQSIINNEDVSSLLLIWGTIGQVIFTFRFFYQWISSEAHKKSILPLGFWIISIMGSLMILIYAIFRRDPVLFTAHILSFIMYVRNIFIFTGKKSIFQYKAFKRIKLP